MTERGFRHVASMLIVGACHLVLVKLGNHFVCPVKHGSGHPIVAQHLPVLEYELECFLDAILGTATLPEAKWADRERSPSQYAARTVCPEYSGCSFHLAR